MKIDISIIDDDGNRHHGELELEKNKSFKTITKPENITKSRENSTSNKIITLIDNGFFNTNRILSDIVTELHTYDYNFKTSDLTLPLRVLVRNKLLKKTKDLPDGKKSKYWTYVKRQ